MKFKKTFVDRDEIDAPEILYKYRDWQLQHHKTIITKQEVYFAAPCDFEDPVDCKLMKRWDLFDEQQIYDRYRRESDVKNPNFSLKEHMEFAMEWTQKAPFKDIEFLKQFQENQWQKYNQRVGVFSVTANPTSVTMWGKYSDNGRGICVGFNTKMLFKWSIAGGAVSYYDELPIIYPNDPYEIESWKQVYSKERKWEFEEEYRLHNFSPNPIKRDERVQLVPKEAYKYVIFGWLTPDSHVNEIVGLCQSINLKVSFKRFDLESKSLINILN